MKAYITVIAALLLSFIVPRTALGQTEVSARDAFDPSAEGVFLDIAVDMAKAAAAKGEPAGGTAIILNGAFHSAGKGSQPEIEALDKAHARKLNNAVVYTVNEPCNQAWIALSERGVSRVVYANPAADVIAAGIYTAADYDPAAIPQDGYMAPKQHIDYPAAAAMIKRK